MHPGNIFVSPQGQYIAVDFGIVGTLNPEDQRYLAENFLAFFNRDYRRVAELHIESGWVPMETRADEFESAIRSVCEPIFEKPLKDISFGQVLLRLFQTARRFHMEVQPQLVLLQKTLLNIEGLGRELNPDLDLWKTAKPFLEDWMAQQLGLRALFKKIGIDAPVWVDKIPEMPGLVYQTMETMNKYHQQQVMRDKEALALREELRHTSRRNYHLFLGGALMITASIISIGKVELSDVPLTGWVLGLVGISLFIVAWPRAKQI